MSKVSKKKVEERLYFDTKYGPLNIHHQGKAVRELFPVPLLNTKGATHCLENLRLSLHLERFEGNEPFLEDIKCVIRFPDLELEIRHDAPGAMRIGFTHGCAVVMIDKICLNLSDKKETAMLVEYFLAETSLTQISIPVKVLENN